MLKFILGLLISYANAHSWLHCVNYDRSASLNAGSIRNSLCNAFPRGIPDTAVFGEDRGYNYQPISNVACRTRYAGNPITYTRGRTYRMLWPAKNHISAPCTNPFIKDQSLKLYLFPTSNLNSSDPSFSTWTTNTYLYFDFKANGEGFQNCPDACPVVDRLPCYGDLFISNNLPTGTYKALWVWIFNPNERFTHCFDVRIVAPILPTKAPTSKTSTKAPTSKTSTKAPTSKTNCVALFQQCGGNGYSGPTCCQGTATCKVMNAFYSQCTPPS